MDIQEVPFAVSSTADEVFDESETVEAAPNIPDLGDPGPEFDRGNLDADPVGHGNREVTVSL